MGSLSEKNVRSMPYRDAKRIWERVLFGWKHGLASLRMQHALARYGVKTPVKKDVAGRMLAEFRERYKQPISRGE